MSLMRLFGRFLREGARGIARCGVGAVDPGVEAKRCFVLLFSNLRYSSDLGSAPGEPVAGSGELAPRLGTADTQIRDSMRVISSQEY